MSKRILIVLSITLFIHGLVLAQDSTRAEVEQQLEEVFEETDSEEDALNAEQLVQFLEDLAANPVNINAADIEDLLQIPGTNLIVARAIIEYRKSKPFEDVEELKKVAGIGTVTFQRIQPYVTVGGIQSRFRDMYGNINYWTAGNRTEFITRLQQNLQEQEGYQRADTNGGYLGNSAKYYQRLTVRTNHVSVAITQEKDAGEPLNSPADFDYTSWHIAAQNNGKLKQVVVGDYSLSFGQGLVLWTGGAFGKGREVIETISKNERGIRPYSSAQETDFFKGFAATYGNDIELSIFYSDRPRTASVIQGDSIRYPSSSGFHRTQSELDRRNNITQQTGGGRVKWSTPLGLLGASAYQTTFSSFIVRGNSINDKYDFEGRSNSVIGIDYRGLIRQSLVFGEIARSENGGVGGIVGVESAVNTNTDLSIAYRHYQKDFQSLLGTGFGETSGNPQNEVGWYAGLRHQLGTKYLFSIYADQYSFKAPRNGINQSSNGFDLLGLVEATFSRQLNAYVLIRKETKDAKFEQTDASGRLISVLGADDRFSVRVQGEYLVSRAVRLRSRFEWVQAKPAGEQTEQGMLIYQDLRLQLRNNLQFDGRITLFDTDSFNSRVYQFENDLLYVLSNVALSDRGQRMYAVIKYEPFPTMQWSLKYSVSIIEDAQTLSSGLGEIEGNKRSFMGIQARLYFR